MSKKLVPKGEKRTKERYVSKVIKMSDKLADLNIDLFPGIEKELSKGTPRQGNENMDTIGMNSYRRYTGQPPASTSEAVKKAKR